MATILTTDSEAERYRKMFLNQVKENDILREQIAEEIKQKYAMYRRIAHLIDKIDALKDGKRT